MPWPILVKVSLLNINTYHAYDYHYIQERPVSLSKSLLHAIPKDLVLMTLEKYSQVAVGEIYLSWNLPMAAVLIHPLSFGFAKMVLC